MSKIKEYLLDRYISGGDICAECGFYTWEVDSTPLENCNTCGRERVEVNAS